MGNPVRKIRNLGQKSSEWLAQVGIHSLDDVEAVGVVETYLLVKEAFPEKVTLNMLWGLQGAVLGIPWNQLPDEMKTGLLRQVEEKG